MRDERDERDEHSDARHLGADDGMSDAAHTDDPGVPTIVGRAAAHLRRAAPPDERAVDDLMAAVRRRSKPRRSPWRNATAVRTWHLSPLAAAALAASLVGIGALGAWKALERPAPHVVAAGGAVAARGPDVARAAANDQATDASDAAPTHTVRFVLSAPHVSRVTLVGDFNGWNAEATPMRWDAASRTWTTVVTLPEGRYVYAFVLDGRRWVADPAAPLAPEDGFGAANSVVLVGGPGGGRI